MTILVVGDSFMSSDPVPYLGKHWSELIPGHSVVNYSMPGASNDLILYHLFRALHETAPKAIVIGFTDSTRIEFKNQSGLDNHRYDLPYGQCKWITNAHLPFLTADQKLAATAWQVTSDHMFNVIRDATNIVTMLYYVRSLSIPFVFTLGAFEEHVEDAMVYTKKHLVDFSKHKLRINLAEVPRTEHIDDCCFHLPQAEYQQQMAIEVLARLTSVGF